VPTQFGGLLAGRLRQPGLRGVEERGLQLIARGAAAQIELGIGTGGLMAVRGRRGAEKLSRPTNEAFTGAA